MTTVTVWNEYVHEREHEEVAEIYPEGIHEVLADALEQHGFETQTATLDDPEHGLTDAVLDETDVLAWWGHAAHDEVDDAVVDDAIKGSVGGPPDDDICFLDCVPACEIRTVAILHTR